MAPGDVPGGTDEAAGRRRRPSYGGDHHRYSLIDQIGARVADGLAAEEDVELDGRDPAWIRRWVLPVLDAAARYFDVEVHGLERLPAAGPFLLVGNHSGGIYMPDFWAVQRAWIRERGPDAPLYALGFDFLYSIPGIATLAHKLGTVPADEAHGGRLLESGVPVLVYPGGDADAYRPWTERHRVDLHGHTGFVRLALRHGVPVVPMVAHGSHDALVVLTRGEGLARIVGFDRLRIKVFPIVLGPPWGLAPAQLPTWPLPAKVTVRICEPLRWPDLGPEAADDPDVVRHCYEEVLGRMQANLDELVATLPHPVATRIGTALGLDRIRRRG